jgi:hypothetical protein
MMLMGCLHNVRTGQHIQDKSVKLRPAAVRSWGSSTTAAALVLLAPCTHLCCMHGREDALRGQGSHQNRRETGCMGPRRAHSAARGKAREGKEQHQEQQAAPAGRHGAGSGWKTNQSDVWGADRGAGETTGQKRQARRNGSAGSEDGWFGCAFLDLFRVMAPPLPIDGDYPTRGFCGQNLASRRLAASRREKNIGLPTQCSASTS